MNQHRIRREIERVAVRYRQLWLRRGLAVTWTVVATFGVALVVCHSVWDWHVPWAVALLAGGALLAALVLLVCASTTARNPRRIARRIESQYPELDARLLAALEQKPEWPNGRLGFLQQTVVDQVLAHARRKPWSQTVPDRRLRRAQLANVASLLGLAALLALFWTLSDRSPRAAREGVAKPEGIAVELDGYEVEVDPGDVEVERGSSVLVLARFANTTPSEAVLVSRPSSGDEQHRTMAKSLDDPVFAGRLTAIAADLSYEIQYGGETSPAYRVTVFDYPELVRTDADLVFPAYTKLEPTSVTDTRLVSAVEGTALTWMCHLNKSVARAELRSEDGEPIILGPGDADNLYVTRMKLERSNRYRVHLVDARGRENREPPELVVRVLPNRRPDLKIVAPKRDVRASPLEELSVKAKMWDDFGLAQFGLSYAVAGQSPREVVLGEEVRGKQGRDAEHLLDLEALEAEPDQLLSYFFWAKDSGPDGQLRRTSSDMFFAEVRHFEEIFRQGEQPPGGEDQQRSPEQPGQQPGNQNAEQAERLAELQKQIVSGTWKLIRRAAGDDSGVKSAAGGFTDDAKLLRDSQSSLLEQAAGLAENLQDAESRRHAEVVRGHMSEAVDKLTEAVDGPSPDALEPALVAEQSAYQALLKLRAREHRVVQSRNRRQQSSGSSRGSQGRSQRQLQQLQLSNSRNRYETQRSTPDRPQETPAEQEDREVFDRLRELARRQTDLNERLKELQSALAEARDEKEREEIRRQLKRLRDEEQRILRDTDELTQRMDEPENQERMAEAREQLQETRDNVRRASESLRDGRVSRAVADGTRAERQLRELRDEFRRRSAGQFVEEMRQIRSDAEQLDQNEEDLSNRLGQLNESQDKSLRGTGERNDVRRGLDEQKQKLEALIERMKETVREAEKPEPLLAEKLYDTVRNTEHKRTEESLDLASELLERGFLNESSRVERQARDGIRELREGVEDAAESVLGDDTEALRRARRELDRLRDEVEREVARADPSDAQRASSPNAGERRDRPATERNPGGERPGGERPGGERPGGERRPGPAEGDPGGETEVARGSDGPNRAGSRPSEQADPRPTGQPAGERGARPSGPRRPGSGGLRGGGDPDGRGGLEPFLAGDESDQDDGSRDAIAPIAGEGFRDWSDRLRDVEQMLDDPELRAEAARIRDRAKGLRSEAKRHSKPPNWELVRVSVVEPLEELHERVSGELLRRESPDSLVPIDADPVPDEYAERVRKYY